MLLLNICRGKADCGDIDILITRPTDDGKSHVGEIAVLYYWLSCKRDLFYQASSENS